MTTNEIQKAIDEIRALEDQIELLHMREMASGRSTRTERDALQARQNDLYLIAPADLVWI